MDNLDPKTLKALADAGFTVQYGQKNDPTGSVENNPAHGPGGLLSQGGANPTMVSAIQRPLTFVEELPILRNAVYNEVQEILTSMSGTLGSNPTGYDGTPAYPGDLARIRITRTYGKMFVGSKRVDVPLVGLQDTYADTVRRVVNFAQSPSPLVPELLKGRAVNFHSASAKQLYEMGIATERALAAVAIDGDNTLDNTSAELGWIQEPDGLAKLIKSGYTDANGTAVPAADSDVITWSAPVTASVGGQTIVEAITDLVWGKMTLARRLGFTDLSWRFIMDERLHRELSLVFATEYPATRYDLVNSAAQTINRDAATIEQRFNSMTNHTSPTLIVGGMVIPVRYTSGSEVTVAGGLLQGDLFFTPLGSSQERFVYLEYHPMDNQYIAEFNSLANTTARAVLNNGLYMTAVRSSGLQDQLLAASLMRLQHRAPFLAARIDDISFSAYKGYRNWDPGGESYFGGGVTLYNG